MYKFKLVILLSALLTSWQSFGEVLYRCEPAESVKARAVDELCDYFVDAARDCFDNVYNQYALLVKKQKQMVPNDFIQASVSMKETFDLGIATVKTYFRFMDKIVCGDQRVRVDVNLKELNADLKRLNRRVNQAKSGANSGNSKPR